MDLKKILLRVMSSSIILNILMTANAEVINTKEALTRELWRHSWHAYLSAQWKLAGLKKDTWWKKQKYEESIFFVIREAIADCITKSNEFAQISKDGIVEFKGATLADMKYNKKHWNALVLYNLLNETINNDLPLGDVDVMSNVYKKLSAYLGKQDNIKKFNPDYIVQLGAACNDIKRYCNEVNLKDFIELALKIKEQGNCDYVAPGARIYRFSKFGDSKNGVLVDAKIFATYLNLIEQSGNRSRLKEYQLTYSMGPNDTMSECKSTLDIKDYKTLPLTTVPDGLVTQSTSHNDSRAFCFKDKNNAGKLIMNELPVASKYSLDGVGKYDRDALAETAIKNIDNYLNTITTTSECYTKAKDNNKSCTEVLNDILKTEFQKPFIGEGEEGKLYKVYNDISNSDNVIAQDIFYALEEKHCFDGWEGFDEYKGYFKKLITKSIHGNEYLLNSYKEGNLNPILDYFNEEQLKTIRCNAITNMFDEEYSVLSIMDERNVKVKINELNYNVANIRDWIEGEISTK